RLRGRDPCTRHGARAAPGQYAAGGVPAAGGGRIVASAVGGPACRGHCLSTTASRASRHPRVPASWRRPTTGGTAVPARSVVSYPGRWPLRSHGPHGAVSRTEPWPARRGVTPGPTWRDPRDVIP